MPEQVRRTILERVGKGIYLADPYFLSDWRFENGTDKRITSCDSLSLV